MSSTACQLSGVIFCSVPSRVIPAIVHQDVDGAERLLDLRDARLAGREIAHVPPVDIDAGDGTEALGRLVARVVVGGHPAAVVLQRLGYGAADTPCSARHQCDPRHALSPGSASRRRGPIPRRRARASYAPAAADFQGDYSEECRTRRGMGVAVKGACGTTTWCMACGSLACGAMFTHSFSRHPTRSRRAWEDAVGTGGKNEMRAGIEPTSCPPNKVGTRPLGHRLDICGGETPWQTPMRSPS